MAKNRLIKHAIDTYKIAPISSWILGLTTGILIAAFVTLNLIAPGTIIVIFPFIIVPIIFSATLQHIIFKTKGQLTLSSSTKSFGLYYNPKFFGSFSVLFSLLKGLIVFFSFEVLLSFITSTVMQVTSTSFVDALNNFYALFEDTSLTYEDVVRAFNDYNGILLVYTSIVIFPSLYLALIFMIYNMSRTSIVIYYKMQLGNVDNRFSKLVYGDVVRQGRMKMFSDYMSLNWPMYVLLALGFAGGTVGGYLWKHDLVYMISMGLLGGAALFMFFLPFYFGNQEALYDLYADKFVKSTNNVTKYLLQSLQTSIDLSIDEKEDLEKKLSNLTGPLEDDDQNDNKKDPDGPQ